MKSVSHFFLWSTAIVAVIVGGAATTADASHSFAVPRRVTKTATTTSNINNNIHQNKKNPALWIPRGGDGTVSSSLALPGLVSEAAKRLVASLKGGKSDTLLLLAVTALVPTLCHSLPGKGVSPILGFLASGVALGPQGMNAVSDIHFTEVLADLGVVLFLFEMGVHLSLKTLWEMRKIVFGLGGAQMALTGVIVAMVARACGLSTAAQVVLGGGLALSSSAFVLQLLKDKDELETPKGKHSFGVLLLQDLAVVPLLVVTPLLAGSGDGSATEAIIKALVQTVMALTAIAGFGKFAMTPLFETVLSKSQSQEAAIAISLVTILGMSFLTEGLGLSNTLGAFLAGVLLSETSFRHTVEREVSPIRGILVGLFFFSVGFEIDIPLLMSSQVKTVAAIVVGLMSGKAAIIALLCKAFNFLDMGTSQEVGCLLSQGGEFAFVAFRLARSLKIFDPELTKLLLTSVSMTMALTPFVESLGGRMASKMKKKKKA